MIFTKLVNISIQYSLYDTSLTSSLCSFNEEQNTPERILPLSQVIYNELKEIQKWFELNKLSLNVKKAKYIDTDIP